MPSVEIVTIGTELLLGDSIDTNSVFIAKTLADRGVDLFAKHSVGDNAARLEAMVRGALDRADGVITTGGLGPTVDDLTKEAIAAAVDATLELDEPSLRAIEERFRSFGRTGPLAPNNVRQAYLPKGAFVLENPHGTAPGFVAVRGDGKFVACFPGVPREMRPMLTERFLPWLAGHVRLGSRIVTRTLHTIGIGESDLDALIEPLFRSLENPKIAMLAHGGLVDVKIMAKAPDAEIARGLIAPVEADLRERIGERIFGIDDESIESALVARLVARGLTCGTAESLTGGSIAERLVRVAGASKTFLGSIVAYDNAVKSALLDVPEETLAAHGAVSEETALAMARGACARLGVDIAIATTGIAGPTGATPGKPIGLVYIAVAERGGEAIVERNTFPGDRDDIRRRAGTAALNVLWKRLEAMHAVGGPVA